VDQPRRTRLPGNRVIRRRLDATRVITMPEAPLHREVPNVRTHAKRFVAGFSVLILVGAVLLMMPWASASGESTRPIDAIFTAVSASAVTGLITVDTATHWSFFGELVILILIQVGGLGFMVGASLVLASLGRGLSLRDTLMMQDGAPTLSVREATDLSKRILRFTVVCEAAGAVILSIRFMRDESPLVAIWHGVFHSISAFCNAGFDLQGGFRSVSGFDTSPVVLVTIMSLIQAGALSYIVLSDIWNKRRWGPLQLDTKLVVITNVLLILGGMIGFLIIEWNSALAFMPEWSRPMNALFQSVAARTAGYASINFGDAHPSTLFLWIAIMFVGGAAGSTAGGIKLATLAILVLAVLSTLRGQAEPQAFGRRIATTLVFRAMAIVALFLAVHFALTLALAITEDVFNDQSIGFVDLMYETMSGLATVGLTTGITPSLSTPGKIVLCLAMFFGRLGPLTAAYALQRRQRFVKYRFPEAAIRLG
jgi:trk system potassium uptake protein TrkH